MKRLLEGLNGPVASVPARAKTIPSHRILVVEDQPALRSLSAQVLVRSGYEVDVAEDGMAGWEALRAESYDLLITDNQMPRLSGLELVKKLRAAHLALPVIMASGTFSTEQLNRHRSLQFAALLLKPFTTDQLLATVQEILRATANAANVATSHEVCLPALVQALNDIRPVPHWGINE